MRYPFCCLSQRTCIYTWDYSDFISSIQMYTTTKETQCNVSHSHDKISIENSCAISKLYKKDDRPSRCGKMNKKRKPRGDRAKKNDRRKRRSEKMETNARKNEKMTQNKRNVPFLRVRALRIIPEAKLTINLNCNAVGAYPRALSLFKECLDGV